MTLKHLALAPALFFALAVPAAAQDISKYSDDTVKQELMLARNEAGR